jgi:SWI/SNF-related matrix-associated actin-dependent regulator of chromatin subfamily A member 5
VRAQKTKGEQAQLRVDPNLTPEELEAERQAEQEAIDEAEPLNEEELKEKEELRELGFDNWHKREFQSFIRGMELYGR